MAIDKTLERVVIGMIAKFVRQDADDLAQVNGRIDLFEIENMGGNVIGIDMPFASGCSWAPICQAQHTFEDKASCFVPQHRSFDPGFEAAGGGRFRKQYNRSNGFVIVLNGIDNLPFDPSEVFLSRHECPPEGELKRTKQPRKFLC